MERIKYILTLERDNISSNTKTEFRNISYLYNFAFDRFDPTLKISNKIKDGDERQARLINHCLNKTGKVIVLNSLRYGKYH